MRKSLVGLVVAVVGACVSLNTTQLAPDLRYDPVAQNQVRIFQGPDEIPEPYVKLALFNASGSHNFTDESDLYNKMREEAAKQGCNGIVLQGSEDAGTAEKIFFGSGADREATAVCVRYGDDVEATDATTSQTKEENEQKELPVIQL